MFVCIHVFLCGFVFQSVRLLFLFVFSPGTLFKNSVETLFDIIFPWKIFGAILFSLVRISQYLLTAYSVRGPGDPEMEKELPHIAVAQCTPLQKDTCTNKGPGVP